MEENIPVWRGICIWFFQKLEGWFFLSAGFFTFPNIQRQKGAVQRKDCMLKINGTFHRFYCYREKNRGCQNPPHLSRPCRVKENCCSKRYILKDEPITMIDLKAWEWLLSHFSLSVHCALWNETYLFLIMLVLWKLCNQI